MEDADPFRTFDAEEAVDATSGISDWTPILPVPADAPPLDDAAIRRYGPPGFVVSKRWDYVAPAGALMTVVVRYDKPANGTPARKEIRPFTYGYGPDGVRRWQVKAIPFARPLYRLDALVDRAQVPVLVVEGEKAADAAQLRFPGIVVTTSSGGAQATGKADWRPLEGRQVTIWPDNDEAGARYAEQVVQALQLARALSVAKVSVPSVWPEGWDLADELPPGLQISDLMAMIASAASVIEEPLPLFPPLPQAERYPLDDLGPILAAAAGAISRKVQVPFSLAAQSVLAAASLVAQAHADVRLPFGQDRPLSIFCVTVAASGDRKTTADGEALWPIRRREKRMREEHDAAMTSWRLEHAAWSAQRKKIEGNGKFTLEQRKDELAKLGHEPERPLLPLLTAADPTMEGLIKAWVNAPAALGLFTAEGGLFVGGHGMSDESKLRTAAALSELWDGKPVTRLRATDGATLLNGRRLALHLMVQPAAAGAFLTDGTLKDQGLLSRVLIAAPDSLAGHRFYREAAPEDDAAIRAYGARITSLAERRWPLKEGKPNELEPRVLPMSAEAKAVWIRFADHVEAQCGRDGDLALISDFAAKAAEHAARIAGILTIIENSDAGDVSHDAMGRGAALADWYLTEALRLAHAGRADPQLLRAQELLVWLQRQEGDVSVRTILQYGPNGLRQKDKAEAAVAILIKHGWVREVSKTPRKLRAARAGGG